MRDIRIHRVKRISYEIMTWYNNDSCPIFSFLIDHTMNYTPAYDEEIDDDMSSPYYRSQLPQQQRDWSNQWVMIALGLIIIALLGLIVYLVSDRLYPTDDNPLVVNLDQPRIQDEDAGSLLDLEVLSGDILSGSNTGVNTSGSALISQDQLSFVSQVFGASAYLKQQVKSDTFTASDWVALTVNPIDSTQTLETPSIQLWGKTNGQISTVLITQFDSNRDLQKIYKLQNFKSWDEEWLTNLSPNNQNILPWANRYYVIATNIQGTNHVATFALKAPSGETYEREWTRRCIGDVCTEPNIKLVKQTDGSYTQKTTTKEISFKPDEYIKIKSALPYDEMPEFEVTNVRNINNIYVKTKYRSAWDWVKTLSQTAKTKYGEEVKSLNGIQYPARINYGNISYINPTISISETDNAGDMIFYKWQSTTLEEILSEYISEWFVLRENINVFLSEENISVKYSLSRNKRNIFDPSVYENNKWIGFRIIPKVADWMNERVAYAVVEPSMEQQIIQQIWSVEKQTNCNMRRFAGGNTGAKFVLYPVNREYDIVATTNCRWVAK